MPDRSGQPGKGHAPHAAMHGTGLLTLVEVPDRQDCCPGLGCRLHQRNQRTPNVLIPMTVNTGGEERRQGVQDHQLDFVFDNPTLKPVGVVGKTRQDALPVPQVDTFTIGPCGVEARTDRVVDAVLRVEDHHPGRINSFAGRHRATGGQAGSKVDGDRRLAAPRVAFQQDQLPDRQPRRPQPRHLDGPYV